MATESIFNTDILIRDIDFLNQKSSEIAIDQYKIPKGRNVNKHNVKQKT